MTGTEEPAPERVTLMEQLPFEPQALQRLRDIDQRLMAIEEQGRIMTRILDAVLGCFRGASDGMGVLVRGVINPSPRFIVFWILTLVSVGGLTVADVLDLKGALFGGPATIEIAPEIP